MPSGVHNSKRGPAPFVPTKEQRAFVANAAGTKLTWDDMCLMVINPKTTRPISKETLQKSFPTELAQGKAKMKALTSSKFIERLMAGDAWAIQFGLRHFNGYRNEDVTVSVSDGGAGTAEDTGIQVTFVRPRRREGDEPV